ncbi:MAG: DUF115 domain-containing protein [Euryarchaeota archaeon]|nr:DUF115 domain-containing protein [Euryarchaeota archaeon]
MKFEDWEPLYLEIIEEFGYSKQEDEKAARLLNDLLSDKEIYPWELLRNLLLKGATVCGNAPVLEEELEYTDLTGLVIAADGATSSLMHKANRIPDIIVTDLDGDISDQLKANAQGAIIIIHAHGDNIEALRHYVPLFPGRLMGTTQVKPFGHLHNFGGFTDGDRAIIMARHVGAPVRVIGFDINEPRPKAGRDAEVKRKKLLWAQRIISHDEPELHSAPLLNNDIISASDDGSKPLISD